MLRFVGVGAIALWSCLPARAQTTAPERVEASRHYHRGVAHYNLQEYTRAISEFEESYRLSRDTALLFNLAQAHRMAQQLERALYFYRAFLHAQPDAPNRIEVLERISALERAITEPNTRDATEPKTAETKPSPANLPIERTPKTSVLPNAAPVAAAANAEQGPRPVYKRWWFWTGIAVVVAGGAAAGVAIAASRQSAPNSYPGLSF